MPRTLSFITGRKRILFVLAVLAATAMMSPYAGTDSGLHAQTKPIRSAFTLQSSGAQPSLITYINGNDLQCRVDAEGELCGDHGGYWPGGTPHELIFAAGAQVAGIIPQGAGCTSANRSTSRTPSCFPWSGDTVAALFFEGTGARHHGGVITSVFDSRKAEDVASWPIAGSFPDFPFLDATIRDTSLYHAALIGRKSISDQDTWHAAWDDPRRVGGRTHNMGVLVALRTHVWRTPFGNDATIYLVYTITNITNTMRFQTETETRFFGGRDSLPDEGWSFDSLYFGYSMDGDVSVATANFATAILPLDLMVTYQKGFSAELDYPAEYFHAPFFGRSPGMIGTQLVKAPPRTTTFETGASSFSIHTNGTPFNDPTTVAQAWRLLSFNNDVSKGDRACTLSAEQAAALRTCHIQTLPADVRTTIGAGPYSLAPGRQLTFVVALVAAPAVATPLIVPSSAASIVPGIPTPAPTCPGNPVRPIEIAAGLIGATACPGPGQRIAPDDINTVSGSMLHRARVARSMVANRFRVPLAPIAPDFALVPGDNSVTVAWEPSASMVETDPYTVVARDVRSPLRDPNFRRDDIEGYRIYRGTRPDTLELIAEFDRTGTVFTDSLCITDPRHVDGAACSGVRTADPMRLMQYRNITATANGDPRVLRADTVRPRSFWPGDTGVPFTFRDTTVQNGFQYFYRVSAFDVNSIRSTAASLETHAAVRSVVPRAASAGLTEALITFGPAGRNHLPPRTVPAFDTMSGTFSGPQRPAAGISAELNAYVAQLLKPGARHIRIDSVVPGVYPAGLLATYHLRLDTQRVAVPVVRQTGRQARDLPAMLLPANDSVLDAQQRAGVDNVRIAGSAYASLTLDNPYRNSLHADWAYKISATQVQPSYAGGSYWMQGLSPAAPHPARDVVSHGALDGVRIFQPVPFRDRSAAGGELAVAPRMAIYRGTNGLFHSPDVFQAYYGSVAGLTRAADVRIYWGNTAKVDSVIDITHDVPVAFSTAARATYGFLSDNDGDGKLTYGDFYYLDGITGANVTTQPRSLYPLHPRPVLMPVDVTGDLQTDGMGFGLYINGEPYLFEGPTPEGEVWTLRSYDGVISTTPSGAYRLQSVFQPAASGAAVPGYGYTLTVAAPARIVNAEADLSRVHAVPDPFYARSQFDAGLMDKQIQFVNMPPRAILRIYTVSGILVKTIAHDDVTGGGLATWDLRTPNGSLAASAVYYFHVSTPEGESHIGRFTVVNGPN